MSEVPIPQPEPADGDPQTPGPPARSVTTVVPPSCPTRTRAYRQGRLVAQGFPAEDLSDVLAASPDTVVWLDLYDPDEADLGIVTQEFGLHPLAVEDAVQDHQRPKLDRYRTHLFADMYAVAVDLPPDAAPGDETDVTDLTTSEISAFVTARALVTVRKADFDVDALQARWDHAAELAPDLAATGVAFLVHGLLDAVVDGHYQAVQDIDDALDALEDQLFAPRPNPDVDVRRRGFELRSTVMQLRRVVAPMREVMDRLLRNSASVHVAHDGAVPYFEDVHDHVLRAVEGIENARDRIASILDSDLNAQSRELNEVTKRLAAWAAIIAVPTAVTGYYGQNVPYPGFGHWAGFVSSTMVIVVLSGGLYAFLRRRGWL